MAAVAGRMVLIVEDDPRLLRLIRHVLTGSGFRTVAAPNAEQGLTLARRERPDLIISDINMPGVDGFGFRERLMADPELRRVPFLFLTARDAPEDEIRGLHYGVDEYITKPFVPAVLAARVEAVLQRHQTYMEMVRRDPLTGLLSRPSFQNDVSRELERLKRFGGVGCLIFMDLDNFKKVNDWFGHAAGDEVLVGLAELLKQQTRSVDLVGRFGGEEFVAFFPGSDAKAAQGTVERLLHAFRGTTFPPRQMRCTFSAGIAEALLHGSDFDTLCRRADEAMYAAKKAGKNRVTVWSQDLGTSSPHTLPADGDQAR